MLVTKNVQLQIGLIPAYQSIFHNLYIHWSLVIKKSGTTKFLLRRTEFVVPSPIVEYSLGTRWFRKIRCNKILVVTKQIVDPKGGFPTKGLDVTKCKFYNAYIYELLQFQINFTFLELEKRRSSKIDKCQIMQNLQVETNFSCRWIEHKKVKKEEKK
eukprot:TRINITY_DN664_c0_g4_i2.p7 TRINITY_DN664_c0_g4~~TRINITY_DN664_c0_g4_i2.p7  ORF type:complete len:157 (-),score=8.02 TRINITY_DN664_c0_g4_i2:76-546(-)